MNFKEMLFFIAKCLTISLCDKSRQEIDIILKTNDLDWDTLVKVSTKHYVLPALYCNFKRVDFLKYLPVDLVEYMEYITHLNRERNTRIIEQAYALNNLLLKHDITPFFLKGTGNLVEGLYQDIGERMIADIDVLVAEEDFFRAVNILKKDKYSKEESQLDFFLNFRHYPKMITKDFITAVEIHRDVTLEKYRSEFNYKLISKNIRVLNGFSVLSFEDQLTLSIIANQINEYGFQLKTFSLRNAYDVLLLARNVDTKELISRFDKLKMPLNCFLANCNVVFGNLDTLQYDNTKATQNYLKTFDESLDSSTSFYKRKYRLITIHFFRRLNIVCSAIFDRDTRMWLWRAMKMKLVNRN